MGRIGVLRKLYRARYAVKKEKFTGQPADPRFVAALGELQKNGFAMIPGFYAPEHCTLLRNEIDKVMADTDLNDLVTKIDELPKLGWDSPECI
jgi:hypothetical protein